MIQNTGAELDGMSLPTTRYATHSQRYREDINRDIRLRSSTKLYDFIMTQC